MSRQIIQIVFKRERLNPEEQNLDHIGYFTDEQGHPFSVSTNAGPRTYKFFVPTNVSDYQEAENRLALIRRYRNGEIAQVRIRAVAWVLVTTSTGDSSHHIQSSCKLSELITTDSIDRDVDEAGFKELKELGEILREFGFTESEIADTLIVREEK